ncbi:MAG: TlpA disulfide reductase family protein [Acidobacteriota bacterium]
MDIQKVGPEEGGKSGGRTKWTKRLPTVATVLLLAFAAWRLAPLYFGHSPGQVDVQGMRLVHLDGTPVAPAAIQGKALVVNFWAPWCPPCRIETPWLEKLQRRDAGRLVVVGVVADPTEYEHAQSMMRQKGITYLLVRDSADVRAAFGEISVLPTSFYVTPTGRVVHTTRGLVPEPLMRLFAHQAIHG